MSFQKDFYITFLAVAVIASFDASLSLQYTVGDSVWSIPPNPAFYTNWSSSNAFYVGDSLVFEFESEFFNVIQVPRLDYESCTTLNPLKILTASPAIVILSEEGVFYYICNISNYCDLGQKISIVVHKHYSTDYPPTPSPSPSLPPSLLPLSPSFAPFLPPQPSETGGANPSQSPAPCSVIAPFDINGSSNGAQAGNRRRLVASSSGIIFWGIVCAGLIFYGGRLD